MSEQKRESNKSPSSSVFGSYGFNPGQQSTVLAAWHQILPRNPRRYRTIIASLNQTLFFTSADGSLPISNLIALQANGWSGVIGGIAEITLTTGTPITIYGTDALYVASLVGGGSLVEQQATISWIEEIYSNVDANPKTAERSTKQTPGEQLRLPPALASIDGDQEAHFNRDRVR